LIAETNIWALFFIQILQRTSPAPLSFYAFEPQLFDGALIDRDNRHILSRWQKIYFDARRVGQTNQTRLRSKPTPTAYWSPTGMIRTAWTEQEVFDAEGVRWQSRQLGYQP
jgi:hypothetical protein